MKITFKIVTVAIIAMLCAVSCQKETYDSTTGVTCQEVQAMTVVYVIDGVQYSRTFTDERSWSEFLDWLFLQARNGHRVSFRNADTSTMPVSKDVQTFETTDPEEAAKWCNKMIEDGYEVSVDFDERTGIYTCTAIK